MQFRFPDNPVRQFAPFLRKLDAATPGTWLAQRKRDGWRRPGYKDGGKWTFYSKYLEGDQALTQPPPDLVAELASLGIPDGTAFDMEWMGRRATDHTGGRHWFELFDLHYYDGQWQGDIPYAQRYGNLKTLLGLCRAKAGVLAPRIILIPSVDRGFASFFAEQKLDPLSEGMVLKRANSTLCGGFSKPIDNPLWVKIKYRD
jgi:ATP-dependent DNA ligase